MIENAKFEYCSEVLLAWATFSKDHSITAFTTTPRLLQNTHILYLIKKMERTLIPALSLGIYIVLEVA